MWLVLIVEMTHVFGKDCITQWHEKMWTFFKTLIQFPHIKDTCICYTYNISWWSSGSHRAYRSLLTLKEKVIYPSTLLKKIDCSWIYIKHGMTFICRKTGFFIILPSLNNSEMCFGLTKIVWRCSHLNGSFPTNKPGQYNLPYPLVRVHHGSISFTSQWLLFLGTLLQNPTARTQASA